jgi:hypothetical protein
MFKIKKNKKKQNKNKKKQKKEREGFGTAIVLVNQNLKTICHTRINNSIFIKTFIGSRHLARKFTTCSS